MTTTMRKAWMTALFTLLALAAACGSGRDQAGTPDPVDEVVVSVQVEPGEVALDVGESMTLAALVVTENTGLVPPGVTWSSQDGSVVSVTAGGTIEALAPGVAVITAAAGGVEGEALVTVREPVVDPPPPEVARVELSEIALTLAEGTVHLLSAAPKDALGNTVPGLAVRWTTGDEGVAQVSAGGEVHAHRAGEVDVTATVHGRSASARVTVTLETPYDLFFEAYDTEKGRHVFYTRDLRDPAAATEPLFDAGIWPSAPVPSPDGERFAVAVSSPGGTVHQLRVVDRQRNFLSTFHFEGHVTDPAWSPDGEHLAFRVHSPATGADVWTMRADGSQRVNLTADQGTSGETSPTWSPLALGRIAYARTAGGGSSLWTMRTDGSDKQQLTFGIADAEPAWSPDGALVAFQRSDAATFGDLWLVGPDGAGARSVGQLPGIQSSPAWSPDGLLLAFTSGSDVYTVRRDGGFLARRTLDGEATAEARPGWLLRR